ncbi:hypothetical protein ACFQZE_07330 [Paenibacillus sp. GCM10027627]|uniref:hypothetical protein n=1 Tax=unclassified Paenibacillus TaxID=185978 RepID=UPI003637F15E
MEKINQPVEEKISFPAYEREMIQYEKLSEGMYALSYKSNNIQIKYTKEQINKQLEINNEEKLREISNYFFFTSGQYRRLIQHFTTMLTFDYLVVPKVKKPELFNSDKFERDYQTVLDYTDNSYIEETERFITFITLLDGVFYGYERQLDNIISIQQLPPHYCRSKFKINGVYGIEFNLRFFDIYKDTDLKIELFKMFPPEFLEMYLKYKSGETKEWVQLDSKYARCHKFQDVARPLLSDSFIDLIDLKEYKEMDKSQSKLNLYKLIVQKLPIDKDSGLPLLQLEEGQALHRNAKKMISQDGIDVITTPLDVQSVNLQERGSTLKDNIERATKNVYDTIGTSKILFSSGSDGGSIGLSQSIKTDEALLFPLLDQFKRWRDNKLKTVVKNKSYSFEILFPKLSIFNRKEMYDMFKDAATLGYSKLLPLTAMGIRQSTFINLANFENQYLKLETLLKPLQTSHTLSGSGGRPEVDETSLSDKGRVTKETNANQNRST